MLKLVIFKANALRDDLITAVVESNVVDRNIIKIHIYYLKKSLGGIAIYICNC